MPKKLTKKEQIERISWLQKWVGKIPEKLESWIETLDTRLQEKLDYSPKSLLPLEIYLINQYGNRTNLASPEYENFQEIIKIYIGEVYIRNYSISLEWGVRTDEKIQTSNKDNSAFIYTYDDEPFLVNRSIDRSVFGDDDTTISFSFLDINIYYKFSNEKMSQIYDRYNAVLANTLKKMKILKEL